MVDVEAQAKEMAYKWMGLEGTAGSLLAEIVPDIKSLCAKVREEAIKECLKIADREGDCWVIADRISQLIATYSPGSGPVQKENGL